MGSVFNTWGVRCPECKLDTHLSVAFKGRARLTWDGTEDNGDHEWDRDSAMRCDNCDHEGVVRDFGHQFAK